MKYGPYDTLRITLQWNIKQSSNVLDSNYLVDGNLVNEIKREPTNTEYQTISILAKDYSKLKTRFDSNKCDNRLVNIKFVTNEGPTANIHEAALLREKEYEIKFHDRLVSIEKSLSKKPNMLQLFGMNTISFILAIIAGLVINIIWDFIKS